MIRLNEPFLFRFCVGINAYVGSCADWCIELCRDGVLDVLELVEPPQEFSMVLHVPPEPGDIQIVLGRDRGGWYYGKEAAPYFGFYLSADDFLDDLFGQDVEEDDDIPPFTVGVKVEVMS